MADWVEELKNSIPEYAKDIKLNLDAVMNRCQSISPEDARYIALAASFATGNSKLTAFISANSDNQIDRDAALTAGALMAQNNVWYPYVEMADDPNMSGLPASLRMNAIASSGNTEKTKFEGYSLAASIIGKCHFCVKGHYEKLKEYGYTPDQLRDIGRIAATINAVSKILSA